VVFVNPAASRMLGQGVDALVGRHLDEAVPRTGPDGTPIPFEGSPVAQTLLDGVTRRFERILSRLDGSTFPAEVVAAATRAGGELAGAVVVFRDVTERHELDRMKDEFISVVGHELRTPLTSIRGAIGLLAGGLAPDLPPQGRRLLEIATVNTDRLMRLINDILDLSRIESGRVELQVEPHAGARAARGHRSTRLGRRSGARGHGDRRRGLQLRRGRRRSDDAGARQPHSQRDQVLPRGRDRRAERGGWGELVRFEVRDQGRGIPADRLEVIFERFQQVDATDAREKGGAGLGARHRAEHRRPARRADLGGERGGTREHLHRRAAVAHANLDGAGPAAGDPP
jgi:PAS domain S-box-containing protein